ncbi:MAG: hypothetical protein CBD16_04300, partial [Betaproteobacteria bacterium TMED156]
TTSRKVFLCEGREMILSDTVGFINKLPHGLIEAFKATLQEAVLADILLIVIDYSDNDWRRHMNDVEVVLREVKADKVARINFFNKIDSLGIEPRVEHDQCGRITNVWASAKKSEGLGFLKQAVLSHVLYNERIHKEHGLDIYSNTANISDLVACKAPSTESLL